MSILYKYSIDVHIWSPQKPRDGGEEDIVLIDAQAERRLEVECDYEHTCVVITAVQLSK